MARRYWFGNASQNAPQDTRQDTPQGTRIDAVRARQGFRDSPVLVVLVVSTLLICLALIAVYLGLF